MSGGSDYSQSSSSSGSVYAQAGTTNGSAYSGRGGGQPKKKNGGFFGGLKSAGHWVEQKSELAARDIAGMPTGLVHQVAVGAPILTGLMGGGLPSRKQLGAFVNVEKQQARGIVQTGEHPLRDPFLTAVTFAPAASGLLRGAELARGVDVNAPRVLSQGAKETSLIRSRSALGRAGQNVYDRAVQGALTKNEAGQATGRVASRLAAHGAKRIGGALDEEARVQQRMRNVAAAMLDRSAGRLSKMPAARRQEQAALELTSVQTTPGEAAAYHEAQAAKGVNPERNQAVAAIYRKVAARDLVHLDESRPAGEKIFINPAHKALAATDQALARVQTEGDRILREKGVRPGEALQSRVDAPGQVRSGGTYVKSTPAREGKPSQALVRQRAQVARLETLHAKALERAAVRTPKLGQVPVEPEKTVRVYHRTTPEAADEIRRTGKVISKENTREIFVSNRKHGEATGYGKAVVPLRVPKRLLRLDDEFPGGEKHYAIKVRDIGPEHIADEKGRAPQGPVEMPAPGTYTPTTDRLGAALSVARDRLQQMEAAAARRVEPTGIVGGEQARPGRGFVSEQVSEKKLSKAEASASRGPVVGAAQSPVGAKPYTGRALEQGLRPKNVTASASRHFRQITRFVNTDARRRAALATGSDVRRSTRDILVREPDLPAEKIPGHLLQALGKETAATDTPAELAAHDQAVAEGLRAAHEMFRQRILDRADESRTAQIGEQAPAGYKWVDQHALGDMTKPPATPRGVTARNVDKVNTATTALTVYFKVGHLPTRAFTNATTNIIQGSARPDQARRSFTTWQGLSEQDRVRALAAAGQHGYEAMPHEGVGATARAASKGAGFYARFVDAPFRFNSLAYELRKIGVNSPDGFRAALDNIESGGQGMPAHEWSRLSAAVRRADREAISYDRISPSERRFIARGLWFYPWLKGASLFTVRSMIEHPYKLAAIAQFGSQGRQEQMQQLGPTPTYEAGLLALGHGARPLTTDLSTFTPFSTPADILESVIHPGGVAGMFNPVVGAGVQAATGTNQYGGATTSYLPALQAILSTTPEQQLLEASQAGNQQNKMFPKSTLGMIERWLAGTATPRRVNRSALNKAAARERSGRR